MISVSPSVPGLYAHHKVAPTAPPSGHTPEAGMPTAPPSGHTEAGTPTSVHHTDTQHKPPGAPTCSDDTRNQNIFHGVPVDNYNSNLLAGMPTVNNSVNNGNYAPNTPVTSTSEQTISITSPGLQSLPRPVNSYKKSDLARTPRTPMNKDNSNIPGYWKTPGYKSRESTV